MKKFSLKRVKAELDRCRAIARRHNVDFNEAAAKQIIDTVNRGSRYDRPQVAVFKNGQLGLRNGGEDYFAMFGDRKVTF